MNLTALVLAALLSMIRPSTYWTPVPLEQIEVIADDIALSAALHDGAPFTGPERLQKHALALAAIAIHESNLAQRVVSCRLAGDPLAGSGPGRSITVFQLMSGRAWGGHTRDEICSNGPLAAYLAGSILAMHARAGSALGVFRGYASGDAGRRSDASDRQCKMWTKAAARVGIKVACWERL